MKLVCSELSIKPQILGQLTFTDLKHVPIT